MSSFIQTKPSNRHTHLCRGVWLKGGATNALGSTTPWDSQRSAAVCPNRSTHMGGRVRPSLIIPNTGSGGCCCALFISIKQSPRLLLSAHSTTLHFKSVAWLAALSRAQAAFPVAP
ncbi:hypothetical protein EYF80_004038 [Liparis tanakae]|uniref:Uncharacterized protein n=1 Tax=Liparis tanakae TaxID=230148 RepID=A0A4Z2J773_9TELE|nr:hypothetical protein EYF80_004038 [Liparis tanakae]